MSTLKTSLLGYESNLREGSRISTAGKVYASNAPKIMLEGISARTARLVILVTYIAFIIGFSIDTITTYESFSSSNRSLLAEDCTMQQFPLSSSIDYSCTSGNSWTGIATDVKNVLSIQLNIQIENSTIVDYYAGKSISLYYDVELYACYEAHGCGNSFNGKHRSSWMEVLHNHNKTSTQVLSRNPDKIDLELFPNTFQIQESIPAHGLIQSYLIYVEFIEDSTGLFSNPKGTNTYLSQVMYDFQLVCRPDYLIRTIVVILLQISTIIVLLLYCKALYVNCVDRGGKLLAEQWWLIVYFFAVLLYQNPIEFVLALSGREDAGAAYAAYFVDFFSQVLLFLLWLCFSDAIHRKSRSLVMFYTPKLVIASLLLAFGIVVVTLQFPTVDPIVGDNRNPVQAVSTWSGRLKAVFCISSLIFMILEWLWTGTWIINLTWSQMTLKKLPYMNTRYLQLSHRFFVVQATAVMMYYIGQYIIVIWFISSRQSGDSNSSLTNLTDNINTVIREQSFLIGKSIFLTTYAFILAFLFLPANSLDNSTMTTMLVASYVLTEEELETEKTLRKKYNAQMRKNVVTNNLLMNQFVKVNTNVFCVEIAVWLRNISFQAYYDPKLVKTQSSFDGEMDLDGLCHDLVDAYYDPQHETFCFVARQRATRRLVVCFRGTASRKQMEDNLNYTLKELDIFSLDSPQCNDGLVVGEEDYQIKDEASLATFMEGYVKEDDDLEKAQSPTKPSTLDKSASFRETIAEGAQKVESGVKLMTNTVVGATNQVVGATTGLVMTAASHTPGLKRIVKSHVHSGFWGAYEGVRNFVHKVLRTELKRASVPVYFTGHSLGGALATLASVDFAIHSLPRLHSHYVMVDMVPPSVTKNTVPIGVYTFGAPRVGNRSFAQFFDRIVPDSFRVIVDGDLVTGLPPAGYYKHTRTSVVIDGIGSGSIIVDPSFVERKLRTHTKASVSAHSLLTYRKGLLGIKLATEYMRTHAKEFTTHGEIDTIRLAVQAGQIVSSRTRHMTDNLDDTKQSTSSTHVDGVDKINLLIENELDPHATSSSYSSHEIQFESRERENAELLVSGSFKKKTTFTPFSREKSSSSLV